MYDGSLPFHNIAAVPIMMLMVISLITGLFVLWIAGLVAAIKADMKQEDKIVWILIIVFLHALGSIIYFAMRPDQHATKTKKKARGAKLHRSKKHQAIGGVCAGLAEQWGMSIGPLRLLYVVLTLATGVWPLLILYIALWAALEER